ncbi:hypothetical protein HYH02_003043 [Chlamydomonas schloesseri]|uniref:Uncharacterized protein n=1 Tax=Chlamydomonas schloesseri TaxID=2026947 RepID=A0A836B9Q2_9CHLO|nr:hypothetical protein HYH02_003043 [Chlamydomonas schloesseri]|eukprot:KAG2452001.1 hypothetical protein HYH02_003043 [Chlamydomonas schloesseri]
MSRDPNDWPHLGSRYFLQQPSPGVYSYRLWLPASYTPDVAHDAILISSPNSIPSLGAMRAWIAAHNYVAVMMEDNEYDDYPPIFGNALAAWDDVTQRVNVSRGLGARNLCTGFWLGARVCSATALALPYNGLVLQGDTTFGEEDKARLFARDPRAQCQVKVVAVTVSGGARGMKYVQKALKPFLGDPNLKHNLKLFGYTGTNDWAPKPIVESALDFVYDGLTARAAAAAASKPPPSPVSTAPGSLPPITLCAGSYHTCALAGGVMKCFGSLQRLSKTGQTTEEVIGDSVNELGAGMPAVDVGPGLRVSAMSPHCFITEPGGGVTCPFWLGPPAAITPVDLGPGLSATAVWSAASGYACALLQPGNLVKCFGKNDFSQLGYGPGPDRLSAAQLGAALPPVDFGVSTRDGATRLFPSHMALRGERVRAATAGRRGQVHRPGGKVACWGMNFDGVLGIGSRDWAAGTKASDFPLRAVDLGAGAVAVDVAAGDRSACAVLEGGDLKCWGSNFAGVLGQGTSPAEDPARGDSASLMGDNLRPVDIGAGLRVTSVAVGLNSVCVTAEPGRLVKCFGENYAGTLAVGTPYDEVAGDEECRSP